MIGIKGFCESYLRHDFGLGAPGDRSSRTYYGSVAVQLGKTKRVAIACDAVDGPRYFDVFSALNGRLARPDEKADVLQRFYRDVAR